MRRFIYAVGFSAAIVASGAVAPSATQAAEQFFDSDGVRIAYVDEGRGEALVLLHGFSTSADEMWMRPPFSPEPMIPKLAHEYRVIAPDLRGHGESDKPHDPALYGCELAEDVIRLLDHLGIAKAHVVGYSMGATVAGKLLASHPDRLLSVTFGGGAPLVRSSEACSEVIDETASSLERGDGMGPLVIALTAPDQPKPSTLEASLVSAFMLVNKDQAALGAVMRSQPQLEVAAADVAACRVPVQFIYGDREASWKVDVIECAERALPDADVVVIKGGDHITTVANPQFWAEALAFVHAHAEPF